MNVYVTKKENLCLFETAGKKQGGKGFVRGRRANENREFSGDMLSVLVREFRGEIITGYKMNLFPMNN